MLSFKNFLSEGINDKGVFKAIFMAGTPGAGKSYTISKLTGAIAPRVVNTDKMFEFLAKIKDLDLGKAGSADRIFIDKSKQMTKDQLALYINSMLPLFIDGTSSNINNLLHRAGILEFFGYDVGMVFVNTDLETSIKRVASRDRDVPEDVIRRVFAASEENKTFYKSKFKFFTEINNNDGELTNEVITKSFNKVSSFFSKTIDNPIGRRNLESLTEKKQKYLAPELFDMTEIHSRVEQWYRK